MRRLLVATHNPGKLTIIPGLPYRSVFTTGEGGPMSELSFEKCVEHRARVIEHFRPLLCAFAHGQ